MLHGVLNREMEQRIYAPTTSDGTVDLTPYEEKEKRQSINSHHNIIMQRLLLALSLTPVFSDYIDEIDLCESRHPGFATECTSCFADGSAYGSACQSLVDECQQLGGSGPACASCYLNQEHDQCAQLDGDIADATAIATADCAVWHPDFADECTSCFDSNDGSGCYNLVAECSGIDLGWGTLACEECYLNKYYTLCAHNYYMIAANACAARHPDFSDDCDVCFTGDSDACTRLISECGSETCQGCYNDKNYAQCAQLDAAAGGDSDDAAASIAACTASLTAADALLAKAAEVCPEVQLVGDVYSVGPLNCDRIHSVYQNNQCCGTC